MFPRRRLISFFATTPATAVPPPHRRPLYPTPAFALLLFIFLSRLEQPERLVALLQQEPHLPFRQEGQLPSQLTMLR